MHRLFERSDQVDLVSETKQGTAWENEAADAWKPKSAAKPAVSELEKFVDAKIASSTTSKGDQKSMKAIAHALGKGDLDELTRIVDRLNPKTAERLAKRLNEALKGTAVEVRYDKESKSMEFVSPKDDRKLMVPLDAGKAQGGDQSDFYIKEPPQLDPSDPKWTPGRSNPVAGLQVESAGEAATKVQERLKEAQAKQAKARQ